MSAVESAVAIAAAGALRGRRWG